eukprot:UN01696
MIGLFRSNAISFQNEGVRLGNAKLGDPGLHVRLDGHGEVRQTCVQVPTAAGALLQVFLDFGHLTSCKKSEAEDQSNSLECHDERCSLVDNQNP